MEENIAIMNLSTFILPSSTHKRLYEFEIKLFPDSVHFSSSTPPHGGPRYEHILPGISHR